MKKIFLIAIAGMVMIFSGCKSGSNDPKAVLAEFMDKLGKKDLEGARKLATAESKTMIDMIEMGMKTNSNELDKYSKEKMEFGEAKIDGDKAVVPVKETESGETLNYILKKENGSWKVAFDKNSIMTMGMEKMKEGGVNMQDSINSALDQMKDINTDSLQDALKEGSKMMDSARKELEKLKK